MRLKSLLLETDALGEITAIFPFEALNRRQSNFCPCPNLRMRLWNLMMNRRWPYRSCLQAERSMLILAMCLKFLTGVGRDRFCLAWGRDIDNFHGVGIACEPHGNRSLRKCAN